MIQFVFRRGLKKPFPHLIVLSSLLSSWINMARNFGGQPISYIIQSIDLLTRLNAFIKSAKVTFNSFFSRCHFIVYILDWSYECLI